MQQNLSQRVQKRLKKIGKSERAASLEAGLSDSFLRNIRDGKSTHPRADTLEKISSVLQTTPRWLMFGEGPEEMEREKEPLSVPQSRVPASPEEFLENNEANAERIGLKVEFKKLSLMSYGQAIAGEDGKFPMNGEELMEVLCPPQLAEQPGAYAIRIMGDSMWPRYEDGEIAFVNPYKHVRKGEYVVAQIMGDDSYEAPYAFVKRFLRFTGKDLVLEQFNPARELRFPREKVVSVHCIVLAGTDVKA